MEGAPCQIQGRSGIWMYHTVQSAVPTCSTETFISSAPQLLCVEICACCRYPARGLHTFAISPTLLTAARVPPVCKDDS
jgi:hypothetical protein